jgi:hypothetical protein
LWAALSLLTPVMNRLGDPYAGEALIGGWLLRGAALNVGLFLALLLMGVAMAAVGWRRLWVAPALIFQLGGLLSLLLAIAYENLPWREAAPLVVDAVLSGWGPLSSLGWFGGPLLLAMVLVPGALITRRYRPAVNGRPVGWSDAAGLTASLLLVWMALYMAQALSRYEMDPVGTLVGVAPLVLFGAALGTAKGWWPWAHLTVGIVAGVMSGWPSALVLPLVLAPPLAALWQPIAHTMRAAAERPVLVLVLLNILNAADAALTQFGLASGDAVELNPVVASVGMPVKLVLVAAASGFIYRLRPRALIWPTLALAAVSVWHLIGLIVNS